MLFFNPQVAYSCQALADDVSGYYCLFHEEFLCKQGSLDLLSQSLFKPGGHPAYPLTARQDAEVGALFEKMLAEPTSSYALKYDLLRHYAAELIHYALKLQPAHHPYHPAEANVRLTSNFLDLLERQFPSTPWLAGLACARPATLPGSWPCTSTTSTAACARRPVKRPPSTLPSV